MAKRFLVLFLTLLMVLPLIPAQASAEGEAWMSFYVSPAGNDSAAGSEVAPFKTLARAQEEVRKYNKNMQGNIVVNLMPGRYEFLGEERWEFGLSDSGSNGYDVIYRGTDPNNLPVISGAKEIDTTWTEGENGIWHTTISGFDFVRELFINDVPAVRARNNKKVYGDALYKGNGKTAEGFYIEKTKMGLYENPEDVELHWAFTWQDALYHVWDIKQDPTNENRALVLMDPDTWDEYMTDGRGTGGIHPYRAFLIENAYELLDEPGEFYYNKKTKVLSYLPREGEDINNAEILCPQIDQLLMISGDNDYKRVHNLRFEHIKFAHATNLVLEQADYSGGQGEYDFPSELHHRMGRAANLVEWADNIDFESCVFFGLTTMALHFRDGVYHSEVVGNVFADLGATGFAAGNLWDSVDNPPKNTTGPTDVAFQAGWTASSKWDPGTVELFQALNTQRVSDETLNSVGYGWYSREREIEAGTKPWIMFDMEKTYTLETVRFSFPKDAKDEQRNHFEVVISNDRTFTDCKVLKTYTEPAGFEEEIMVGDGEKYRYIMLRKTESSPFCLNGIWAMSNDRAPQGTKGAPADCLIANNYFTRVGQTLWSAYGIWVNWTKNFEILHNVIYDVPYSGMSIGWGWYNYDYIPTAGNNKTGYNRVDKFMQQCSDGGGIYTFGKQYDSEVFNNYVTNGFVNSVGIYCDGGCTGVTVKNNVVSETCDPNVLNSQSEDNKIINQWATSGKYSINTSKSYYVEPIQYFDYSNLPEEVVRIMTEAGLEEEWLWIEERVPSGRALVPDGPDAHESFTLRKERGMHMGRTSINNTLEAAHKILEQGNFGNLPWQYAPSVRTEIAYWVDAVESDTNRINDLYNPVDGVQLEDGVGLKNAVKNAYASVQHLAWEEMVALCEELAKMPTGKVWGGYPTEAMETFTKGYQAVVDTNPQTKTDKAVAVTKLEALYSELYNQVYAAEILSVRAKDCTAIIDSENKTVTLTLADGVEPGNIIPDLTLTPDTEVAARLSHLPYADGQVVIPLYHTKLCQYVFWTMKLAPATLAGEGSEISFVPDEWSEGNINAKPTVVDGALYIAPWFQPTMLQKPLSGPIDFSLMIPHADTVQGVGIVFCAQAPDIMWNTKDAKNVYYLLELKGQDLSLYKVHGIERELCATTQSIGFQFGDFNPISISVVEEGEMNRVEVRSGNLLLMNTLVANPIGTEGYFGILSQDVPVKLK